MPSQTSDINAINLQVRAEDQYYADRTNGTYSANVASDSTYYLWQSDLQTIPVGMDENPEQYAAKLREALPAVNTLRLPFNAYSFNSDGSLHEQYERFLVAAAAEGFEILFVYMDGDAQRYGQGTDATANEIYAALNGEVIDRAVAGWTSLLDWLDDHTSVKSAAYGFELINEPATYDRGAVAGGNTNAANQRFVELYANHVVQLANLIDARADGNILVGGWDYSANFQPFVDYQAGGIAAIDYIRNNIGTDLVWSSHLYPGWLGSSDAQSVAEVEAVFERTFLPLAGDDVLITETNALGSVANDPTSDSPVFHYVRAYEWLAENGIGAAWFPGAETGASNFVVIDGNGTLRFLHQDSYAHGMNLYSLGENPVAHRNGETIQTELIAGRLRNEAEMVDGKLAYIFDEVRYLGLAFGYGGNDTIRGSDDANDFAYGGSGNDRLIGRGGDDFLFGQYHKDTLSGGSGRDHLFGGDGDDTLYGGSGNDQLEGGDQNDVMYGGTGHDHLRGGNGNDILVGGGGRDVLNGGAGIDLVDYQGGSSAVTVMLDNEQGNLGGAAGDTYTGIENIRGSEFADDLRGDNWANTINGHIGNDFIMGKGGNDTLIGSNGNDILVGGDGNDVLSGGNGKDRLIGGTGNDRLIGNDGDDVLLGGPGSNQLLGGAGADRIFDGTGDSVLGGGEGNDRLVAGSSNDRLYGDDGNDILNGGNGIDRISGGAGNDYMIGGNGADIFIFRAGTGADVIGDFENDFDRLFIESSLAGGATNASAVVSNFANVVAGDVVFDFGAGNTVTLVGVNSTNDLADDLVLV